MATRQGRLPRPGRLGHLAQRNGAFLGKAVLNDLDPDNDSASERIWLAGSQVFGRGSGTEATRLVVDHAFEMGLHRLALEVFEHNPRAARVYANVASSSRGDTERRCCGTGVVTTS